MRNGLYRVAFHNVHGRGSGVIYAAGGKLRGGNSAFAFVGSYTASGDHVSVKIMTRHHTEEPGYTPLFGEATIVLQGKVLGDTVNFEGSALQLPGVPLQVALSLIEPDA